MLADRVAPAVIGQEALRGADVDASVVLAQELADPRAAAEGRGIRVGRLPVGGCELRVQNVVGMPEEGGPFTYAHAAAGKHLHGAQSLRVAEQEGVGDRVRGSFQVIDGVRQAAHGQQLPDQHAGRQAGAALAVVDVHPGDAQPRRVHPHVGGDAGMGVDQGLQSVVVGVVDDDVGRTAEPVGHELVVVLAADDVSGGRRIACRTERRAVSAANLTRRVAVRRWRRIHVLLVGAGQEQQLFLRESGPGGHAGHLRRRDRRVLANQRLEAARGRQPAVQGEPVAVPVFPILRRQQRANALAGGSADRLAAFPGSAGGRDQAIVDHGQLLTDVRAARQAGPSAAGAERSCAARGPAGRVARARVGSRSGRCPTSDRSG